MNGLGGFVTWETAGSSSGTPVKLELNGRISCIYHIARSR